MNMLIQTKKRKSDGILINLMKRILCMMRENIIFAIEKVIKNNNPEVCRSRDIRVLQLQK